MIEETVKANYNGEIIDFVVKIKEEAIEANEEVINKKDDVEDEKKN